MINGRRKSRAAESLSVTFDTLGLTSEGHYYLETAQPRWNLATKSTALLTWSESYTHTCIHLQKPELPSYTDDRWCDIPIAWLRNDGAASEPRESIFIVSKCIKLRYGEKERSQLRRASSALPIPLQIHSNNNNYTHNQLWVLIRRMKTHLSSTNRLETIACTTNLENF